MVTENKQISIVIVEDFKLTRVGLRCALNSNPDLNVVAECEDAIDGIKKIKELNPRFWVDGFRFADNERYWGNG